MPKKILFESAIHQLASATKRHLGKNLNKAESFKNFVQSWQFSDLQNKQVKITWTCPKAGDAVFTYDVAKFYTRGDLNKNEIKNNENDFVQKENEVIFDHILQNLVKIAGIYD